MPLLWLAYSAMIIERGLGGWWVNQWEAWNWSCDLRANERPGEKMHLMAHTDTQTDRRIWRLYDKLGPVGPSWWKRNRGQILSHLNWLCQSWSFTKWWSYSVKGLLSTGPTRSSFFCSSLCITRYPFCLFLNWCCRGRNSPKGIFMTFF